MTTKPERPCDGCDGGQILRDLIRYLVCHDPKHYSVFARMTITFDSGAEVTFTNASGANFMITIPSNQKKTIFKIAYQDADGNPAVVDGAPVWTGPDAMFGTFETSGDGMKARLTLADPPVLGAFQLRVDADADLGDGVKSLITLGDCEIVGGEAVVGVISGVADDGTEPVVNPLKKK